MKKKTQHTSLLNDLRNQDPKRRYNSVQCLKEIATFLGPLRTRTEFIQYLSEFIDDEQHIVLELLNQLSDFSQLIGGSQYEKLLIPLLMAFCKTDQKKEAQKASQIIQKILIKNKDLILDVVKKLAKVEMTTSKQAATRLISSLVDLVPQNQTQLEEIGKLIEIIYNQTDDLPKILALEALIKYYPVNFNTTLTKFKGLFILNNWRINIKICEHIHIATHLFSKAHFKSTFQLNLMKFLDSSQPQLRAKACGVLKYLAQIMTQDQIKKTLIPVIKKLSVDPTDYVKVQLSQNIVSLVQICNGSFLYEQILPIIFSFIKNNDLAVGIIKNFQAMTKKLNPQTLQQKILFPLTNQFLTQNWKTKCKLIQLLRKFVNSQVFLNQKMMQTFVNLISDRINAVRQKSTLLLISVINQQTSQWSDNMIIPKLLKVKNSKNYNQRQALLQIIEKTVDNVSQKTLNQVYRPIVLSGLVDKVSNVRAKALKTLKQSKKLYNTVMEKYVEKLKTDQDLQVKQLALGIVKA